MEGATNTQNTAEHQETKWYVLRVVSGKERKVKEYLDKEISRGGWGEIVKQVFLPVEKVYKVQNGKKVMRERNYYPGYVMHVRKPVWRRHVAEFLETLRKKSALAARAGMLPD